MTGGFDQLAGELRSAERRHAALDPRPDRIRGVLLSLATTAVVAAVVAVVLFTGAGTRHRPSPGGGPATSPAPDRGGWRLRCPEIVGTQRPPRGMRIVLGALGLPGRPGESRALQVGRDGARLFAKSGLWVRAGARLELSVPSALRGRLTMTWGNAGEGNHGTVLHDPGCRVGHTPWLNFVGGYWVAHPLCATLVVTSGGRSRRVRIGVGTPCPGQRPPFPPSRSYG